MWAIFVPTEKLKVLCLLLHMLVSADEMVLTELQVLSLPFTHLILNKHFLSSCSGWFSPWGGFEVFWRRQLATEAPNEIRNAQDSCGKTRSHTDGPPHREGSGWVPLTRGFAAEPLMDFYGVYVKQKLWINRVASCPYSWDRNYILLNLQNHWINRYYLILGKMISRWFCWSSFCKQPLNLQKLLRYKLNISL